jgi:hypothetical protein
MDGAVANGDAADVELDVAVADADAASPNTGSVDASDGSSGNTDAQGDAEGGEAGCPSDEVQCGGGCVPSDTHNCGACGHDCLGGACSAGMCQPVTLASVGPVADLTTDGTTVYWVAGTSVFSCPSGGCNQMPVAITNQTGKVFGGPDTIFARNGLVYWVGNANRYGTSILSCPTSGCPGGPKVLQGPFFPASIATDGSRLYWQGIDTNAIPTIFDCPLGDTTSCAPTTYVQNAGNMNDFLVVSSGADIAWVNWAAGTVMVCAAGNACNNPTTLASKRTGLSYVALDAAHVYWFDATGLSACPIAGCTTPISVAPGQSGDSLASDGTNIYWASGNSVLRADLSGSITSIASNQAGAGNVAVDSARVYWSVSSGAVMSLAK